MSKSIAKIKQVLAAQQDIRFAIVFGSLATGTERFDSDVDEAVDAGMSFSANSKMDLIAELALATGRPVDLVDLRSVGEPLLGQILQHGKRIIGDDSRYAELISRHLFDQADFVPCLNRILAERRQAWIDV